MPISKYFLLVTLLTGLASAVVAAIVLGGGMPIWLLFAADGVIFFIAALTFMRAVNAAESQSS